MQPTTTPNGRGQKSRRSGLFILASLFIGTVPILSPSSFALPPATAPTSAPTTSPATTKASPGLEALLRQLGAGEWKIRDEAQEKLIAIGEEAVPRLKTLVNTTTDPEVRTATQGILRRIDDNRMTGTTFVTIHMNNTPAGKVYEELARQGHTEFGVWPPNLWTQTRIAPVSLNVDHQPFWTVMQELNRKTNLQLQHIGMERKLSLVSGDGGGWMAGPSATSGPFLIVARTIYRSNSVDLTHPDSINHDFNIGFYVFPEPKLKILQIAYEVTPEHVVDEKGNSLVSGGEQPENMSNGYNGFPLNMTAHLNYPENAGKRIKVFKGFARCVVDTHSEVLEIPDILAAHNVTRSVAGRTITVKRVTNQADIYSVEVLISRGGLSESEWDLIRNMQGQIRLLDAGGKSLNSRGGGGSSSDRQMDMSFQFARDSNGGEQDKPGQPVKLIWDIPTESKELPIPIEFNDLPIP